MLLTRRPEHREQDEFGPVAAQQNPVSLSGSRLSRCVRRRFKPKLGLRLRSRGVAFWRRLPVREPSATSHGTALSHRNRPATIFQSMKVRDAVRLLTDDGWCLARTRGSHEQYKHPTKAGLVTVAGHPGDELAPGTLNSILKQAGLKA